MTGSSEACVAQHNVQMVGTCPRDRGEIWQSYTPLTQSCSISMQVEFCALRHWYLCSNSKTPTVTPQGLAQYVLIKQPSGSIWNALPWTFQVESIGLEKLKLVFPVWELKQHNCRVNRFPSFKAEWGKKPFILQSLHMICSEAEYLCFIRVNWVHFLTGGFQEHFFITYIAVSLKF